MKYTKEQMLAIWRRRLGFDEVREGCTVESFDGHAVDDAIAGAMRRWYLGLLDTAPAALVPVGRVAGAVATIAGSRLVKAVLPSACRRVLSVEAARWNCPALPVGGDRAAAALARLSSPYGVPDDSQPLAMIADGGRALLLAPLEDADAFTITGVVDPGPDEYDLDESLLQTIPSRLTMP